PNYAPRLGAQFGDRILGCPGLFQHRTAMSVETLADLGDDETPGGPLQQAYTQAVFKLRDALAQAGLGDAKRPAGRGEPTVLDHRGKKVQIVQVLQGAIEYRHIVSGKEQ